MALTWFDYSLIVLVTYLGEVIGAIVGGGGFIIQSYLIAIGIPPHEAVANEVSAAAGTGLGSLYVFLKLKLIRWNIVKTITPTLLLGSVLGLFLLDKASPEFIEKFIAILALSFVVYGLLFRKSLGTAERELPKYALPGLCLFGFVLGAYTTFSGAGVGTFATYIFTTAFGTTFIQALAIQSVLFSVSMTLGFFGYLAMGLINFNLLAVMFATTVIAGITGAKLATLIGNKWLRPVFLVAVLGFAVYLLLK